MAVIGRGAMFHRSLLLGGVTKGQRSFFLFIGGRLVAGQSSPHRHEADGGDVTKGQRAFFLIIGGAV